ncbi:E4 ORFB [Tree shrew adenovirus 1]|uniref:E4 ORFB n=1 Tax=Tree shrew adenovirus serotype 1 TaxID=47680 RepID=UPI00001D9796|nr:E4 ORFB [Tree shrew adenovirus 1]
MGILPASICTQPAVFSICIWQLELEDAVIDLVFNKIQQWLLLLHAEEVYVSIKKVLPGSYLACVCHPINFFTFCDFLHDAIKNEFPSLIFDVKVSPSPIWL